MGIAGTITGSVTGDGRLNMAGAFNTIVEGVTFRFEILAWDTDLVSAGQMNGRWVLNITAPGFAGNAYHEGDVAMTQMSTGAVPTLSPVWNRLPWSQLLLRMR